MERTMQNFLCDTVLSRNKYSMNSYMYSLSITLTTRECVRYIVAISLWIFLDGLILNIALNLSNAAMLDAIADFDVLVLIETGQDEYGRKRNSIHQIRFRIEASTSNNCRRITI